MKERKSKKKKKRKEKKGVIYYIKHTYKHIKTTFSKTFKKVPSPVSVIRNFIFVFIIILTLSLIEKYVLIDKGLILFIAPFTSTACTIIMATESPFSQPSNVFFGHLLSGFIGVSCYKVFGVQYNYLSVSFSISLSAFFMQFIGIFHFPGLATSVATSYFHEETRISRLGYLFLVFPISKILL
jgi:CBS-domain-containing membrane protein